MGIHLTVSYPKRLPAMAVLRPADGRPAINLGRLGL